MSFTLSIAIPPAAIGLFTTRDQLALKQILREAELKSIALDLPTGRLIATASTQAALDTANGLAADRIARSAEIERVKAGRLEQRRVGISVHAVGLVLGRLGATIRRLRDQHGLERVEVHEGVRPGFAAEDAVDEHRKHVLLVGGREAIDAACVELDRLLRTVRPVDVLHGHLVRLAVPVQARQSDVGRLAEWLRLNVPGVKSAGVGWSRDLGRPELWIRGQKSAVAEAESRARQLLQEIVAASPSLLTETPCTDSAALPVPTNDAPSPAEPVVHIAVIAQPGTLLAMRPLDSDPTASILVLDPMQSRALGHPFTPPLTPPPTPQPSVAGSCPSSPVSIRSSRSSSTASSTDVAASVPSSAFSIFGTSRRAHASALVASGMFDLRASLGQQVWRPRAGSVLAGEPTFSVDLLSAVPLAGLGGEHGDPSAVVSVFDTTFPLEHAGAIAHKLFGLGFVVVGASEVKLRVPMRSTVDGGAVTTTYIPIDPHELATIGSSSFALQSLVAKTVSPISVHIVRPTSLGQRALDIRVDAMAPDVSLTAPTAILHGRWRASVVGGVDGFALGCESAHSLVGTGIEPDQRVVPELETRTALVRPVGDPIQVVIVEERRTDGLQRCRIEVQPLISLIGLDHGAQIAVVDHFFSSLIDLTHCLS